MTVHDDRALVGMLRDAAAGAAWPPTPDLRASVLEEIERAELPAAPTPDLRGGVLRRIEPSRTPGPYEAGGRAARLRRVVRPLLLAAALAIGLVGIGAALGFRLPGLVIERVPGTPAAGSGLDLGTPIPLADALAAARPRVLLPAALPTPDIAYRRDTVPGPMVTLAWRGDAGARRLPGSDLALSLMAVPASVDEELLRKLAGPGTHIESVDVAGDRGWWIEGAPHEILVRTADGAVEVLPVAIAGDTLVFERDGTLYRLESSLGRDATLEVARSLR